MDASAPGNPVPCWLIQGLQGVVFSVSSSFDSSFEGAAFAPFVHDLKDGCAALWAEGSS